MISSCSSGWLQGPRDPLVFKYYNYIFSLLVQSSFEVSSVHHRGTGPLLRA